ncbi:MAG: SpoIIIAH-like family protein [Ruminococcus sp.]
MRRREVENYFAQARLERLPAVTRAWRRCSPCWGRRSDRGRTGDRCHCSRGNLEADRKRKHDRILIQAQGYSNCIVYLDGDSAKVVVQTEGLDAAQAAAIKDVILGEVSVPAENIRIFEVK